MEGAFCTEGALRAGWPWGAGGRPCRSSPAARALPLESGIITAPIIMVILIGDGTFRVASSIGSREGEPCIFVRFSDPPLDKLRAVCIMGGRTTRRPP